MRVLEAVRRLAAPAAGLLGAGAICIACSSSTTGTPDDSAAGSGGPGIPSVSITGIPSFTGIPSISGIPSIGIPSISGIPSIGGDQANSAFCKDFTDFDPSSVGTDPTSAAGLFDKMAEDAPAEVKDDVETIRDFISSAVGGHPDTSKMQDYTQAISNLISYTAAHCAG